MGSLIRFRIHVPTTYLLFALFPVLLAACSDSDPLRPGDISAEYARVKEPAFSLQECYVYQDQSGQSWLHLVGTGDFDRVGLNPVQDYHFNGSADDDYSPHFEYNTLFNDYPPPHDIDHFPDGTFHVDLPWDGARAVDPETGAVIEYFKDLPTANVDQAGADPFSFHIRFRNSRGTTIEYFNPQGIILSGNDTHETKMAATSVPSNWHAFGPGEEIFSYARFKGDPPGGSSYLEAVYADPTSFTCSVTKSVERINKQRVTVYRTEVTGTVGFRAALMDVTDPYPALWVEMHILDITAGGDPVFPRGKSVVVEPDEVTGELAWEGSMSVTLDGSHQGAVTLQYAVDYVFPNWWGLPTGGFVYDPYQNTNVGFTTTDHVSTRPGDHGATAWSQPVTVVCQ